jgi:hypothetical protein
MEVHTCNPSTWETEAGGWRHLSQPGLHNETLYQKIEGRGYSSVMEHFLSKALSLIPSSAHTKYNNNNVNDDVICRKMDGTRSHNVE